jgi:parallel beta-helix repeat protein
MQSVLDLQGQIDALAEGQTLELPAGTFELPAPLLLRRSLHLRGQSTTLRLSQGREAVVRAQGSGPFRLSGLHLVYAGEGPARGVWVESGELCLEDCKVSGARWVDDRGLGCGIHYSHEARGSVLFCELFQNDVGLLVDHQSQVKVESNRCYDNRLQGMRLQGFSRCRASQNECRANGEAGIWVLGNAWAELEGNRCHGNSTHGILLSGQSQSRAVGNEVSQNLHHGLSVEDQAWASLEQQVCEDNGLCGLDLGGDSKVQAATNYCTQNAWHGIQVRDQAWPLLGQNRCRHNQHSGLAYYGQSGGSAREHWLEENEQYAVQVCDQALPTLWANRCTRNGLSGLAYFGQAGGSALKNQCSHNPYHGIQVSDQAQPVLEQNSCQSNQLFGLACFGHSKALVRQNHCQNNAQGGFYVGDQAEPQLWENQASDNGTCGLQVVGRSGGMFVENHLVNNGACGIQIGPEASPWLSANSIQGHSLSDFSCLSSQVVLLEKAREQGQRMAQGHHLSLQDGEGQTFLLVLPFEPKPAERLVLEALARHGKLSEGELSKVASTRRIAGLLESLREKLNRAGLAVLENQGQGSEGAIYAFVRVPTK